METVIARKFNISTAFGFIANAINEEKTQLQQSLQVARGVIEAAQSESDTKSKSIGAKLFFHKLEDLIKNVLHSYHESISPINEEDLIIEMKKDDREMYIIAPVVFSALFLIIYYFRWKMVGFYNKQLEKKIIFVITGDDLIIEFSAKEDDGTYFDFRGDVDIEHWKPLNDFLAGKVEKAEGLSKHIEVLRLINASQQYTADLFEKHPNIFGNEKPIDPFVSFSMDAQCMSFKIENAFRS